MEFLERIDQESEQIFIENGWEIPKLPPAKMKINGKVFDLLPKINNKDINSQIPDYESMRKKTHPFDGFFILKAMQIIKNKIGIASPESETESTQNTTSSKEPENNFLESTIEDWLYPFKEENILSDTDYSLLVAALKKYFETGSFPVLETQIKVKRVNKKRFGWALNQIYRGCKSMNENLPIEYLMFAKQNISIFSEVKFDPNNILKSNLYKYFTTKTN